MAGITSVPELLARASAREAVRPSDARAGAVYERLVVDGDRYFLKRLSPASDWIMRAIGDRVHRPYLVWTSGLMERATACVDPAVTAMSVEGVGEDAVLTIVMRDVGELLIPPGDDDVTPAQHAGFITGMADLSRRFWGWRDDLGLTTMAQRMRLLAPDNLAGELAGPEIPGPVSASALGWRRLAERSPTLARLTRRIHDDPGIITARMDRTPVAFLQGDWKMGNLGMHPDGRVILLDWAFPGCGPPCWELCWYLTLNRARLPESKEQTISRFRAALEHGGSDTSGWWQEQLDLCLIGVMATFGWEKALGDDDELRWWERAVADASTRLGGLS
jgi:hypothetical protein